ncbi:MAG: DUF3142 domain-containing protein [Blastocatellia bacterium]
MADYLKKLALLFCLLCGLPLLHAALSAPRTWAAAETPVAFWAWRAQAPTSDEISQTGATRLFLRAGQFDFARGEVRCIRAVEGRLPGAVETHLVYNATRDLLAGFETIEPPALAQTVAGIFAADLDRAALDGVCVAGLQLDLDVPTRLLPRYAAMLRLLRASLPQGLKLSITGLPTWMDSSHIGNLLDEVDFWTPQFYGWTIPDRIDKLVPISSPATVRQAVVKARELNRPFYAGLAAYGYAILYSPEGKLLEVRGDLDPALVAGHSQFELVESRPFDNQPAAEWRSVYRALGDAVIDGLVVRRGEQLMLDSPSSATLRAAARAVREEAGEQLLGISVFRLPGAGDPTTLTAAEIAAALADRETTLAAELKIERPPQKDDNRLMIAATNTGTARARLGPGAMALELRIPPASLREISGLSGFAGVETLCDDARPCSLRRASLLRLKTNAWSPGASARANLIFSSAAPPAQITVQADDGRSWQEQKEIVK